jgi:hypothetical protein
MCQQYLFKAIRNSKPILLHSQKIAAARLRPSKQVICVTAISHTTLNEIVECGVFYADRAEAILYNVYQLPLREILAASVRRVGGWSDMAAILRGCEPGNRGTSHVGRSYQATQ